MGSDGLFVLRLTRPWAKRASSATQISSEISVHCTSRFGLFFVRQKEVSKQ
jgi:hypothetical protein